MALIKPEQLQSGSYSITGSFSGSFYGDGSNLNNLPVPSIDTGSLVTTSSFNSFTSSYYADSGSFSTRVTNLENFSSSLDATFATEAELNAATSSLSASIANLSSSFEIFSGSYNTGSFTGSFIGDLTGIASYADSASYALTASYLDNYIPPFPYTGSAEITGSLSVTGSTSLYDSGSTILSINGSQGEIFSISDDLTGDLLVVQSGSTDLFIVSSSGATTVSGSLTVTGSTNLYNSGSTVLSVNGFQGEIFSITDDFTGDLFIVQSGSTDLFVVSASGDTTISGSLIVNGPQGEIFSISDDLTGDLFTIQSGSTDLFIVSSSGDTTISGSLVVTNGVTSSLYGTASWAENAVTASYTLNTVSASFASTASYVNTLNQNVLITGSLTVLQGATIYGSSSFTYVTASQLAVSASFISVNVFEPVQRFGGLIVYDSGSSLATASIAWDSLHNHWVYQNASGSTYTGGMFLSGPRNTGSLGDEPTLTKWFIPRSDGTDHLDDSQIFSSGSIHQVTGSLTVTQGVTASLQGTASWASNALTSSYSNLVVNSTPIGGVVNNGEILYRNGGVLSTSTNLAFNATLGRLSVGQGLSPGARLDIKAQGSASSDSVLRVRNNGNTFDILNLTGNNVLSLSGSSNITGSLTSQPITLTATSGTASINCTQGNFFDLTLSSSSTIHLSSSNIQPGQTINLRITQPATSGSLTYGSQFKFAGGIPYSASATGSAVDIVSFISFDSTTLYGSAIKNLS